MIEYIIILILLFEVARLFLYIGDSRRTKALNNKALEFAERQSADWKKIRVIEIAELKRLAEESDTMKQIYDEWLEYNERKEVLKTK